MIFHKAIEKAYKAQMFRRYDDTGTVKYFTHADFEGLHATPYAFRSSLGHTLHGNFYFYEGYDPSRLVIFEHGFGGGHLSYMKEIEMLCRAGFLVLGYDHTGCMTSEGAGTRGFSQFLRDLDDLLTTLEKDAAIDTTDISVVGHSTGGYAAMNISALHTDVKRVVVLSGFVSVEKMIEQTFSGILSGYRNHIFKVEHDANPGYAGYDGITTLLWSKVKALLIYSDNDPFVKKEIHYDALYEALHDKPHAKLVLEHGKGHNPNYTVEAVRELEVLGKAIKRAGKHKTKESIAAFRDSFDWEKMTAQDPAVWEMILAFLKDAPAISHPS